MNSPNIITTIKNTNAVEQIILVCLLFFVPSVLVPYWMLDWFSLPNNVNEFLNKPWTIFTYGFVHIRFLHIFSNLLVLYYFGNLFVDFFNKRIFLIYYLSGILAGGVFFLVYSQFSNNPIASPLIGSSAAVTAIFIGLTAKVPHYALNFRFIGNIEIWILAVIWVFLSVVGTSGVDPGASVAHLGGGVLGYALTFIYGDQKWFKFNGRPSKKIQFKKVYKNPHGIKTKPSYRNNKENQEQINAILDKISKSGYDSLSKDEKEFLFNQKEI